MRVEFVEYPGWVYGLLVVSFIIGVGYITYLRQIEAMEECPECDLLGSAEVANSTLNDGVLETFDEVRLLLLKSLIAVVGIIVIGIVYLKRGHNDAKEEE